MRLRFRPVVLLACAGLIAPACAASEAPRAACEGVELLVAASDYSSSVVCGAPECVLGPDTTGVDLGQDPMLTTTNGRAFFLARDKDTLFELDPACGTPIERIGLSALQGTNPRTGQPRRANPQDVAAAPDGTLVVPLYDVAKLAFVVDGRVDEDSFVDLSPYDPDGNPQANAVRIVTVEGAPKAFVSLERLDDDAGMSSTRPSQMLRVDVATRAVEATIELAGRNPFNVMAELHGALFLASPGSFDSADDDAAGIERFETATSTTRMLVRERDLGASVVEVAVTDGCGAAIVAGPEETVNPTSLVTFDPDTGELFASMDDPVLATPGYDLQGLAFRGDSLYVGDRRSGPGGYPVHVLSREGGGCALRATGRSVLLPQQPVALRAALPKAP